MTCPSWLYGRNICFFSICVTRLSLLGPERSFFFFWFKNNLQCCSKPTRLWNMNAHFKVSSLCISSKMKVSLSSAPQHSPRCSNFFSGLHGKVNTELPLWVNSRLGRFLLLRPLGSFVYRTLHSVGENQSVALFATVAGPRNDDCRQDLRYKVAMLLLRVSPCGLRHAFGAEPFGHVLTQISKANGRVRYTC